MIQKNNIILLDVIKATAFILAVGYLVCTVADVQSKPCLCEKMSVAENAFSNALSISYEGSIMGGVCVRMENKNDKAQKTGMRASKRGINLRDSREKQRWNCSLTEGEYELLSRLVAAEAENQSFEAQYMIACVVENRVRSEYFPDTLSGVIWQSEPSKQFSAMWNGRYGKCSATERSHGAVRYMAEHGNRLPEEVLYFTSCGYLPGTKPYRQVDNIYFSCWEGME